MQVDDIKKAVCFWINTWHGGDPVAIVTPSDHEAPSGTYIAVRDLGVENFGRPLKPPPGSRADENPTRFLYVAELQITEVEGAGELLRSIRNEMLLENFREYAEKNGFTLWTVGDIVNNDMEVGKFWVRQKSFGVSVNFTDVVMRSHEKAESVGLEINGTELNINL